MRKLLLIVFMMFNSSAFAGIGDAYNCEVIDGVIEDYNKEMSRIPDDYKNDPISDIKFVWLEENIIIKFNDDLFIPIENQIKNLDSFDAYDGYHKLSFFDGLLIWSSQGHHPTGYLLKTYRCKKF